MSQIKVLLVDDHEIVLQGLRMILDSKQDILVVHAVGNGQLAVDYVKEHHVDVVLMDISLPVMNGVEACRAIKASSAMAKVIMVSGFNDKNLLYRLIDAGADGSILKEDSTQNLYEAILRVMSGKNYFDRISEYADQNPDSKLSDRENDVLRELSQGRSDSEMATALFISENTIKSHVKNIKTKLGVTSKSDLITYALNAGLI